MAAVTADSVVVELEAKIAGYEARIKGAEGTTTSAMSSIERSANRAELAIRKNTTAIADGSGKAANASRNLGRQIADIGTQLSGGQSIFLILAQQAPQVADALADVEGRAGRVAAFFAGPWGAALLAAASIAGTLAGKLLEGEDATNRHKKATDALKDAIDKLNSSSGQSHRETEAQIRLDIASAESQRLKEIQIRKTTQAQLQQAKAALEAAQVTQRVGGGSIPGTVSGVAGINEANARARIDDLNKQLGETNQRIEEAARAQRGGEAAIGLLRVAAATDKVAAANQRYEKTIDALRQKRADNTINQEQFEREALAATKMRDAVLNADKAASRSRKAGNAAAADAVRAANEEAAANDALDASLRALEGRFDPVVDAARIYAGTLDDINEAVATGRLGPDKAVEYRFRAMAEYAQKIADATKAAGGAPLIDLTKVSTDDLKKVADAGTKAFDIDTERHREQISSLADFYQRAFEGGAGGIWDMFRSAGTRAIAEVLAKWTIGQAGGALTKLLPSLGSFFGRPGRASGGSVSAGVLYRINESSSPGQPEGFMPQGSGKIIPLGQMNNLTPGGGTSVLQTLHFDLSGAVLTSDLLAQMNQMAQTAAVRGAAGGSSLAQSSLARRERYRLR